jgi:hypothetical protein
LIDKTLDDAQKKLRDKVRFAFDRLPAGLRAAFEVASSTTTELCLIEAGNPGSPASSFEADLSFRGSTCEFLHISEWGFIQQRDRHRSREILTGALPAVERAAAGVCVIESTWSGGLDGELGGLTREALDTPEAEKGLTSWRVLFFPWWRSSHYRAEQGRIDPEAEKYFSELAQHGVVLDDGQRRWYATQLRTKGARAVRTEYPSLPHECWETQPEGSIYAAWIEKARSTGRILSFEPDSRALVWTCWDIGHPANTATWWVQVVPGEIRVIDFETGLDISLADRAARVLARGWHYAGHLLPWDAGLRNSSGRAMIDEFNAVLPGCRVVPKCSDIWQGIDSLRALFGRLVFRVPQCQAGVESLGRYSAIRETSSGLAKDVPIHDKHSHPADALRQLAQAIDAGMIPGAGSVTGRPQDRLFSASQAVLATSPHAGSPDAARRAVIGARRGW